MYCSSIILFVLDFSYHASFILYVTIRITNGCDFLYYVFISFFSSSPYVFRAFMGPSSGVFQAVDFYATIWFMQCFVDRLRASADWFVVVTSVY